MMMESHWLHGRQANFTECIEIIKSWIRLVLTICNVQTPIHNNNSPPQLTRILTQHHVLICWYSADNAAPVSSSSQHSASVSSSLPSSSSAAAAAAALESVRRPVIDRLICSNDGAVSKKTIQQRFVCAVFHHSQC